MSQQMARWRGASAGVAGTAASAGALALAPVPQWVWPLWSMCAVAVVSLVVRSQRAAAFGLHDGGDSRPFRETPNGNFLWWLPWMIPVVAAAPNPRVTGILTTGLALAATYGIVLRIHEKRLRVGPRAAPRNRIAWGGVAGVIGVTLWLVIPVAIGPEDVTLGFVTEMAAYGLVGAVLVGYLPWMNSTVERESSLPGSGLRLVAGGLCLVPTPVVARLAVSPQAILAAAVLSVTASVLLLEPVRRRDRSDADR